MLSKVNFKVTFVYLFVLLGITITVALVLAENTAPDIQILGRWKEVNWTFEKVNRDDKTRELVDKEITDEVKDELGENLFIHRAEVWEFRRDGSLILHKDKRKFEKVHWNLKGFGRVLKLHYGDEQEEYYDIDEITDDYMTLYFDVEIQAKGIVKMQFRRLH